MRTRVALLKALPKLREMDDVNFEVIDLTTPGDAIPQRKLHSRELERLLTCIVPCDNGVPGMDDVL